MTNFECTCRYDGSKLLHKVPGRVGPGSFRPGSFRPILGVGRFGLGRWVVRVYKHGLIFLGV